MGIHAIAGLLLCGSLVGLGIVAATESRERDHAIWAEYQAKHGARYEVNRPNPVTYTQAYCTCWAGVIASMVVLAIARVGDKIDALTAEIHNAKAQPPPQPPAPPKPPPLR